MPIGDLAQAQRIVEGQGVRDAALIRFGRHDPDVVGKLARNRLERREPGGVNAVVVRAEDAHQDFGSRRVRPPM